MPRIIDLEQKCQFRVLLHPVRQEIIHLLRLAGKKTQIVDVTTEEYGAAAPRPAYSILENRMFKLTTDFMFADWHDAIAEYMKEELG